MNDLTPYTSKLIPGEHDIVVVIAQLRHDAQRARADRSMAKVVAILSQALAHCLQLPPRPEFLRLANAIRLELRRPLLSLGRVSDAKDLLCEGLEVARALQDELQVAWIHSHLAHMFWLSGDMDSAVEYAAKALSTTSGLGDGNPEVAALRVNTLFRIAKVHHSRAEYRLSMETFAACLAVLPLATGSLLTIRGNAESNVRTWIVWNCGEVGKFVEGVRQGEQAVSLACGPGLDISERDRLYGMGFSLLGLGTLRLWQGEGMLAISLLRRAQDIVCRMPDAVLVPRVLSSLGAAYAHIGDSQSALPLLERAVEYLLPRAEAHNSTTPLEAPAMGPSGWLARLGDAYLRAGRLNEARNVASQASKISLDHSELGYFAWATKLMGDIAAAEDPPDFERAEEHYCDARKRGIQLGMEPLASLCDFASASLCQRIGDKNGAMLNFHRAQTAFAAMEMPYWVDKCTQGLAKLDPRLG